MGQGSKGIAPIECINNRLNKWRVRWNIQQDAADENAVTFNEKEYNRKPTLDDVKKLVLEWINLTVERKIIAGFVWNTYQVSLSDRDQMNYKAAYDIAAMSQGDTLPIKFKFGTTETPQYHTFTDMAEFTDFYTNGVAFKQQCLEEGWQKKDGYDFSEYEKILESDQI